jgi:tripartite-type tricarboxylate transporter receptor subunit TctC
MKLPRRRFLQLAASAPALPALVRSASADTYPSRPVRILVGYAPGGVNDIVARLTGQILSDRLGQPFAIENHPGAGSNVATEEVVRAAPDGYTLLEASTSNAWNAAIYQNLNFDFIRDIVPVASTVRTFNVMIVNSSFPANSVPLFIQYAKAHPGEIKMGAAGPGSSPHLFGELFKVRTGIDLVTVQFRGDDLIIPELLAGRIQVVFGSVVSWIDYIKAGDVRPLGVTSAQRTAILPHLPPISQFVPDYEGVGWQGIGAPKNTPAEIVEKLNREINAGLEDDKFRSKIAELGGEPFANSPAEFGQFIAEYTSRWAKIIRAANIKAQ